MKMEQKKFKLPRPDYYQGVLQLRDASNEVMEFVQRQIDKRDNVAITKTVSLPNGVDLYITSQKYLQDIGKKLKESFGGELKVTSRLHTKSKTGKDLYRVTVFFKLQKYKRGDIIEVRGDKVQILHLGKRIFARDVKTGKRIRIRSEDMPQD